MAEISVERYTQLIKTETKLEIIAKIVENEKVYIQPQTIRMIIDDDYIEEE